MTPERGGLPARLHRHALTLEAVQAAIAAGRWAEAYPTGPGEQAGEPLEGVLEDLDRAIGALHHARDVLALRDIAWAHGREHLAEPA